jgi:hypothetical protein
MKTISLQRYGGTENPQFLSVSIEAFIKRDMFSTAVRAELVEACPELAEVAPSHSEMPFDKLRANGNFVMRNGKPNSVSVPLWSRLLPGGQS